MKIATDDLIKMVEFMSKSNFLKFKQLILEVARKTKFTPTQACRALIKD